MNCPTARQILDLASPDDPRAQAVDEAARHVDGCAACQTVVRRHEAFDKKLVAMMGDVPVPAGLRERLLEDLAEVAQHEKMVRRRSLKLGISCDAGSSGYGHSGRTQGFRPITPKLVRGRLGWRLLPALSSAKPGRFCRGRPNTISTLLSAR